MCVCDIAFGGARGTTHQCDIIPNRSRAHSTHIRQSCWLHSAHTQRLNRILDSHWAVSAHALLQDSIQLLTRRSGAIYDALPPTEVKRTPSKSRSIAPLTLALMEDDDEATSGSFIRRLG